MRIFLFILSFFAFIAGFGILVAAKSAIHEIEAFMLFLVSSVLLIGAAIVEAITQVQEKLKPLIESSSTSAANTGNTAQTLRENLAVLAAKPATAEPSPVATNKLDGGQTYYYSVDGNQTGPYTAKDMRELRKAETVTADTLVFKEGDTQWRTFAQFVELAS